MSKTSTTLTNLFDKFWRWFQGKALIKQNVRTGLPGKLPQSWQQRGKPSHIFWDIENLKLPSTVKKQAPKFAYNLRTFFSASRIITAVENPLAEPSTSQLLGVLSSQCNVEVLSYIRPKIKVTGLSPGSADFQIKQAISRFVKENPVGSTLTLITSDADFAPELAKAKELGFHVNLLCDRVRSNPRLKEASDWHYDWIQYLESQFPPDAERTRARHKLLSTRTFIPANVASSNEDPSSRLKQLRCVVGYPASFPDTHMLLHACASATLSGPLKQVQLAASADGKGVLVEFCKAVSARLFTKQQRLVPVAACHPKILPARGSHVIQPLRHPGHVILALHDHPRGSKYLDAERNADYLCKSLTGVHFVIGTFWQRQKYPEPVAFISLTADAAGQFANRYLSPLRIPCPSGNGDLRLQWEAVSWSQAKRWMMSAGPEPDSDDE